MTAQAPKTRQQKEKRMSRKCMGSISLEFFSGRNGGPTDALKPQRSKEE